MKEKYSHELNFIEKLLGVWRVNKDSYDTKWGYFSPQFGLELAVNRGFCFSQEYSLSICLIWGKFNINLPFKTKLEESCDWPVYGINVFGNCFIFQWGKIYKSIDIPFISYVFEYHKTMNKDGEFVLFNYNDETTAKEKYDFSYTLKSGKVQNVEAECIREVRQWHRKWLPFIKMRDEVIDVSFSGEIGERSGSWKGGTVGCSYKLLPDESIESCLRRMEKERKFR